MAETLSFPGYDPDTQSVPDTVLGTLWDIWEGRGLARLDSHYASDVIHRDAALVTHGITPLRQDMMGTLAAFPDLAMLGEDVIWCDTAASKDTPAGAYASMRTTATATHTGPGPFGDPTGKGVRYRVLTDGWTSDGLGRDIWQVRDTGAVLRQIGTPPRDWVAAQLETNGLPLPLVPDTDVEGPYPGRGSTTAAAEEYEALLRQILSGDLAVFDSHYDRACETAHPGGATGIGRRAAEGFWLGLRTAFPSAAFRVEHNLGLDEAKAPERVALRWSLYGKHDGPGMFGPATGSFVFVMGITHAEFGPRGLRREWTLIDETAIWTQILGN